MCLECRLKRQQRRMRNETRNERATTKRKRNEPQASLQELNYSGALVEGR